MSTFVSHLHHDLSFSLLNLSPASLSTGSPSTSGDQTPHIQSLEILRDYFARLSPPTSIAATQKCIKELRELDAQFDLSLFAARPGRSVEASESETALLRRAILGKLMLGLYIQSLNTFLEEASRADEELQWWGDVARSRSSVALYLLQTLPSRLADVSRTILNTLRRQNIPLHLSAFYPSSLHRLFPTRNILRPNTLTVALFPYLRHQPYAATLPHIHATSLQMDVLQQDAEAVMKSVLSAVRSSFRTFWSFVSYPLYLVEGECHYKRKQLEKIRDQRAETLGVLSGLRKDLQDALEEETNSGGNSSLGLMGLHLQRSLTGNQEWEEDLPTFLDTFAYRTLPLHIADHECQLSAHSLRRPSRWTLLWPRLVFLPPLILYAVRSAYVSRASLAQLAQDTADTLRDFWQDWLLAPLKDVVKTVRAGSDDGVIITHESVKADLNSLERMTLALAQDKLGYTPNQMAALSQQIRLGDLTPVMQLYEDDIKSPLRSAVGGTLLRTLFIQVQKAKVDIDQALSGIDKLLKSQELTFAFVGVAPAFAIVYVAGGALHRLWTGTSGRGRYGGKRRRVRVWLAMRRVERLLIAQPRKQHQDSISPLTSGLLLLSVTYLRKYGETHLPAHSRLREGFLEDISDLESPDLGRAEKMRVVDRMWKSWGVPLGWGEAAVLQSDGGAI
ncbi:Nuclear control of ATPase protein 2 [Steccherinum ochraceum]|uniref:Nuclear control of ATPase protein 2 n=1 Tax=Steccherinum ochraceum TaxID=92696 RepID=A0A4R0R378_9APHY|nr:Nuclear control of ATPase protein 2 [Steccherinum ochraceum]